MGSQSPAANYWARRVLSVLRRGCHEGTTPFTHCRWAFWGFWLFKFCLRVFCFVNIHLKGKYTVIVITARVFQRNRGEAIGVRVKVVRVHHAFARHQLVALDFGPRFE